MAVTERSPPIARNLSGTGIGANSFYSNSHSASRISSTQSLSDSASPGSDLDPSSQNMEPAISRNPRQQLLSVDTKHRKGRGIDSTGTIVPPQAGTGTGTDVLGRDNLGRHIVHERRVTVSPEEQRDYYLGLPCKPRLVGRTGPDWKPQYKRKFVDVVGSHPIAPLWQNILGPKILDLLDKENVRWNSLEANRIGYEFDDKQPSVVVLVGIAEGSLKPGEACRISAKAKNILRQFAIEDVEVEMREREVLPAIFSSNDSNNVTTPDTPTDNVTTPDTPTDNVTTPDTGGDVPADAENVFSIEVGPAVHKDASKPKPASVPATASGSLEGDVPMEIDSLTRHFQFWNQACPAFVGSVTNQIYGPFSFVSGCCVGSKDSDNNDQWSTGTLYTVAKVNGVHKVFLLCSRHGHVYPSPPDVLDATDYRRWSGVTDVEYPINLFTEDTLKSYLGVMESCLKKTASDDSSLYTLPVYAKDKAVAQRMIDVVNQSYLGEDGRQWIDNRIGIVNTSPALRTGSVLLGTDPYAKDWCMVELDEDSYPRRVFPDSYWEKFPLAVDLTRASPNYLRRGRSEDEVLGHMNWSHTNGPMYIGHFAPKEDIFYPTFPPGVKFDDLDRDGDGYWVMNETIAERTYKVYKFGWATGHTLGTANNVPAFTRGPDSKDRMLAVQIPYGLGGLKELKPKQRASDGEIFAMRGDSGSLIIDEHKRAFGVITHVGTRKVDGGNECDGFAYAVAFWQILDDIKRWFPKTDYDFNIIHLEKKFVQSVATGSQV